MDTSLAQDDVEATFAAAPRLYGAAMHRGIFVAPFDELSDPRLVADCRAAEEAGWDGFFVWDHIGYSRRSRRWPTRGSCWPRSPCATEPGEASARWSRRCRAGAFTSWRGRPSRSTT